MPIQRAGHQPLHALRDGISQAGRTRVYSADAGDLGFGGVARMQQRRQVRQCTSRLEPRLEDGAREPAGGFPR